MNDGRRYALPALRLHVPQPVPGPVPPPPPEVPDPDEVPPDVIEPPIPGEIPPVREPDRPPVRQRQPADHAPA